MAACTVSAAVIAAATLSVELHLPPGFAAGVPHLAVLGPAVLSRSRRAPALLASLATFLVVAGHVLSGADLLDQDAVVSRALVVIAAWGCVLFLRRQIDIDTRHRENEIRFRDFAEIASDWLWETDAELRYTYLSPRFRDVTGVAPGAVLGRTRFDFRLPDDDPEAWERHSNDLRAHRAFHDFRLRFRDVDGRVRFRTVSGKPIFDETGRFCGYRGTGRDITQEVEAQQREAEALAAQRALADAIDRIDVGVALYDTEDRLRICNRAYKDIYRNFAIHLVPGTPHADLVRRAIESGQYRLPEGGAEEWRRRRIAARKSQQPLELQLEDGRWIMLRDFRTAQGTVSIRLDITRQRAIDDALRESEQRYRDILGSASDWFWEMDEQQRLTGVSPRLEDLSGFDPAAFFGQQHREFAQNGESGSWRRHAADLEARRPFRHFRYTAVLADGTRRYFSVSGVPVFGAAGEFKGYRGAGTDITAQVVAESALRESEARFKAVVDNLPAGVFLRALDGSFLLANQQFRAWFCANGEDPAGRRLEDVMPAAEARRLSELDALVKQTMVRHGIEDQVTFAGGERRSAAITQFPVMDGGGALKAIGGIVTDVDAYKRLEAELRQALHHVEQANRAKSEFLANVSHELRTPLNAIIGFSEIIHRQAFGPVGAPRYLEYAEDINASGHHLLAIINDILDMAKIEAGEIELKEQPTVVADEVAGAMRIIQPRAEAGRVRLVMDVPDDLPQIYADRRILRQILLNLLSNGVKFTPEGGSVTVSADVEADGGLRFRIDDTGIGIAEEDLELVMHPFQQADSALSRKYEGTGLGLPLVQSMVGLHGGSVVLDSVLGQGTTATVRLPAARVLPPQERRRIAWAE